MLVIPMIQPTKVNAEDISTHPMAMELNYWINLNVIQTDANGKYNPNAAVTRGEFASYIARALQLPNSTKYTFTDLLPDTKVTQEIQNAAGAGILGGYADGTFKPTTNITRQQMAGMISNALRYLNVPLELAPLTFVDNPSINPSFVHAVGTAVYYNIIRGSQTAKGTYFYPKNTATIAHAAAFLYRMNTVAKQYSTTTTDNTTTTPTVNVNTYYVGHVNNGALTIHPTIYQTYAHAEAAYEASSQMQVILKGKKIIKMRNGIAYAADTVANTTTIYDSRELKNQISYTTEGRELKYLGSNDTYAIVQLADTVGYAKISDVELTPTNIMQGSDYYYVSNNVLSHKIYNHVKKAYEGEYVISDAPNFMKNDVKYTSFDGVHFYSPDNKLVGTYFPYFQFASVRQPSNYTAEELDNIIQTLLTNRQALGVPSYANATTKSKLIGTGNYLKELEKNYHVNALFILSAAVHESNYGMSAHAQKINNLFGIRVFDSTPEDGEKYATPQASMLAFVTKYINLNYVPQSGKYAKGAVPGNKTTGINVHYASDPHWGSKIAGHMWRIDNTSGQKDINKSKLGMVLADKTSVNTRLEPIVNATSLVFTYKAKQIGSSEEFGYPVAIVEEQIASDGFLWYKVHSDDNPPSDYVWIRSDLMKVF